MNTTGCSRRSILWFAVLCAWCLPHGASAQTFTRITTGAIVTDLAASRSAHWIDFDKDGDLDCFVTSGKAGGENNILYRNDGPPFYTFTRMSSLVVSQDGQPSDGATWGDYDNDGDDDLFVVNWYGVNNMLYRNEGDGSFVQIFSGAPVTDGGYSETASWGDYDNDGRLDLVVSNSAGDFKEFLYHNLGNGTFQKITTGPIPSGAGESRGLTWVDYDGDTDLDLFVANESNQNDFLYRNMRVESGADTFQAVTSGVLVTSGGSSWSGSWGDYNNDGDLDLFVSNNANQNNALFENLGGGTFMRMPTSFGDVVDDSGSSASSSWIDADNDGDLDLYVSNAYGGPGKNFYYRNLLSETGAATFERELSGAFVNDPGYTYGFAWGDYDEDGDVDLYCARTLSESQANALYRNDGNANHWVTLDCKGTVSNGSAIGARIRVKAVINALPVWQLRVIEGQQGYCAQTLQQHFGLESASVIDSLIVEWPSGAVDRFANLPADRHYAIAENQIVVPEPASPADRAERQLPTTTLRWRKTLLGAPFHVQVSADSAFAGPMIYENASVRDTFVTMDSLANTTTFFWRVRQSRSIEDESWSQARSFVVGASTFGYGVDERWNLVSVPVSVADYRAQHLFPSMQGSAYAYGVGAYQARETLATGPGYWLRSSSAGELEIAGVLREPDTVAVSAGWNLIGSGGVGRAASALRSIPEGIIDSPIFGYSAGYAAVDSLRPFRGYWVRTSGPGTIVYADSAPAEARRSAPLALSGARIEFSDAAGHRQFLHILAGDIPQDVERAATLPPVPPAGVFDIRFASGSVAASVAGGHAPGLLLRSVVYPLTISWRENPLERLELLMGGGDAHRLDEEGELSIKSAPSGMSVRVAGDDAGLPQRASLSQNYPNPFNPSTSIEFTVPARLQHAGSQVTLEVYDLLGRIVATLASGSFPPGRHRVDWDAAEKPDGIYYCRLRVGEESMVRKMIVLR